MLKTVRVFLATLVLTAFVVFFLDFARILPDWFAELTAIQAVPALLAVNGSVLAALLVLTLVLGRVYCSVLCPLGVLQDGIGRLYRLLAKKKPRFRFAPARTGLRWSMAALATAAPLAGLTVLLSLLDPYSIFGRVATHLFRPVYVAGNNVLETLLARFDLYLVYHVNNSPFSLTALAVALAGLVLVGLFACRHGRNYCNTLCPVGTVLGIIGGRPLFGIRIDMEHCSRCGKCEARCKGFCIDSRNGLVDFTRCVACMNCLEACDTGALRFSLGQTQVRKKAREGEGGASVNSSRRAFLLGSLAALPGLLPGITLAGNGSGNGSGNGAGKAVGRVQPVLPPGAGSLEHFMGRCTACHACMGKCPSRVLKPALLEYGPGGFLQPLMDYSDGFCSYDCTICTQICPSGALRPLSLPEKHHAQIGRVVFVEELCIVRTQGTHCGACAEHCPTQAVTMVPYSKGVTIPALTPEICVGCGGCEFICPVRPNRAIFVEGLAKQAVRETIQEEKREKPRIDSFGF